MKILLLTGPLYPLGNNSNLILKVFQRLAKDNEIHILSSAYGEADLPETVCGFPVHWITEENTSFADKVVAKLVDRNGYSDYIQSRRIIKAAKKLHQSFDYDFVVSTSEPFPSAYAAGSINRVKKLLYIMDPPESVSNGKGTAFRRKKLKNLIEAQDFVLTTPFIKAALEKHNFNTDNIECVGFPMICDNETPNTSAIEMDKSKINLLFCGWLYSSIRSPEYFLTLAEALDERFCIYFMGKECEKLFEQYKINTNAQIITMPQQPYDVALGAMEQADILINIGNSIPVHMPSKTLEYINTGKPMINFHKMTDCPTLYYTNRYPLCLNIYENTENIERDKMIFKAFCIDKKGAWLDREQIKTEYADCTPEYIAGIITDKLGEKYV